MDCFCLRGFFRRGVSLSSCSDCFFLRGLRTGVSFSCADCFCLRGLLHRGVLSFSGSSCSTVSSSRSRLRLFFVCFGFAARMHIKRTRPTVSSVIPCDSIFDQFRLHHTLVQQIHCYGYPGLGLAWVRLHHMQVTPVFEVDCIAHPWNEVRFVHAHHGLEKSSIEFATLHSQIPDSQVLPFCDRASLPLYV